MSTENAGQSAPDEPMVSQVQGKPADEQEMLVRMHDTFVGFAPPGHVFAGDDGPISGTSKQLHE